MRGFLEFIMRGRKQAMLMAMLFGFIPFFGWVSSAIVALITLRIGIIQGLFILLWTALPSVALAWMGDSTSLYFRVLAGTGLTWILAIILRATVNWRLVLLAVSVIGILTIGIVHWVIPDVQAWWMDKLQTTVVQASKSGMLEVSASSALGALKPVTVFLTGILVAFFLLMALFNLVMARWWQALLYNPGGLKKELYQLRLDKIGLLGLLIITAVVFLNSRFAQDCLPVLILPLALIGVVIVHVLLANTRRSLLWLVVFYGVLILLIRPVVIILAMVAVLDSLIDVRKRLKGVE